MAPNPALKSNLIEDLVARHALTFKLDHLMGADHCRLWHRRTDWSRHKACRRPLAGRARHRPGDVDPHC
mgnify:CR=1 FL=1